MFDGGDKDGWLALGFLLAMYALAWLVLVLLSRC